MSNDLMYGIITKVITTGSLGIGNVKDEVEVRFVIDGASGANSVLVRARILNSPVWTTLAIFVGDTNEVVNVFSYDQLEVIVTAYGTSSDGVTIVASSFDGSTITFTTPSGDITGFNTVEFTSSDNSVIITGNPTTGVIDLVAVGGGGSSSNFEQTFNATSDWTGPSGGSYTFTMPFGTHAKTNPIIQMFELSGSDYIQVETGVKVNPSDDIIITVNSTPDLRFVGKIVIS